MNKLFLILISAGLLIWSCEDNSTNASQQNETDYDELALVQNVDEELAIIKSDYPVIGLDSSDVQLMLSWDEMPLPFFGSSTMGHATLIAFGEQDKGERPFMRFGGLDMGDVTLETPEGSIDMHKLGGRSGGAIYNIFPGIGRGQGFRGRHNFNGFEDLPFIENGTYSIDASGSDDFEAIRFSVQAPAALLQLDTNSINAWNPGEDLNLTWSGADPEADIIIAARPSFIPRANFPGFRGQNNNGGHNGRHFGFPIAPERFAEMFNNARFGFEKPNVFLVHLDGNKGSYTIPADSLQALLDQESESLLLHISAMHWNDVSVDERKVNAIIRMQDRALLFTEE